MTPDRVLDEVLAATEKDTDPFPLPVVAPGKVIQLKLASFVAVQAHPFGAMTLKDPEPPAAAIGEGTLVGFS